MPLRHERAAESLLVKHGWTGALPVDVESVAASEGIAVVRQALDPSVSGLLLRDAVSITLGVNETHSSQRQRFTIAHELGHYLLHPGRQYTVDSAVRVNWRNDLSSLATDREEIDANAFGAALLMPADSVRAEASALVARSARTDEVIAELADLFSVSQEAMGYRLINLGISS